MGTKIKFLRRIISISLLFILLICNSGLAVATHYCEGSMVESQFVMGHRALNCGESNMDSSCEKESSNENNIKKKICCEDQYQFFGLEDEFQRQEIDSSFNLEFVAAFVLTFIERSSSKEDDKAEHKNYIAPLIERDILILVQSFLL